MNFGTLNPKLTNAIRHLARDTSRVRVVTHAELAMEDDGFDHGDVFGCLRKGDAYGPEVQNGRLRANVLHRGLHIRVVVGGLDQVNGDWSLLKSITVVTVMKVR